MKHDTNSHYSYIRGEVIETLISQENFDGIKMQPTRGAYAEEILELGEKYPEIVVLNADVSRSIGTSRFAEKFPERSFNFGIAEQNMMAAAAGMATTGLMPFVSAYAVFATMRALDQVRNSIHYPQLNVKIAASHGGVTPSPDGVTHQCQEDLAIMRSIAHSVVIAPADPITTKMALNAVVKYDGPVFLSFTRDPVPFLFDETYPFRIGQPVIIRQGKDATIIAVRDMISQALIAAETLYKSGLDVRVIDCHTIKPIDPEIIIKAAKETGAIVTVESGVINGGLGSAISEIVVENYPVPMKLIGMDNIFAESGSYNDVITKFGLTAKEITKAVQQIVNRK